MDGYILSVDQSTSASKACIIDRSGACLAGAFRPVGHIVPQEGWVEQDPEEIWRTVLSAMEEAIKAARILPEDIRAIGIANQRCTTVAWNRRTGQAIGNALGWQDRRTRDICGRFSSREADELGAINGSGIFPNLSVTKLRWLLENDRAIQRAAAQGELLFGTMGTWLIWKLTGGTVHIIDHSNAAATGMLDVANMSWASAILQRFSIPLEILPSLVSSSESLGHTDPLRFFGAAVPIAASVGDQAASAFSQMLYEPGRTKNSYGTGSFLVQSTGETHYPGKNGIVTPALWVLEKHVAYGLEGFADISGELLQWLKTRLSFVDEISAIDGMAMRVPNTGDVYLVPAMLGLRRPSDSPTARGTIFGLNLETTKNHIARAALESLAYQTRDTIENLKATYGLSVPILRVDGGSAQSDFLMQFQADILGVPVERPRYIEAAIMGAAYLAGLAVGYWDSLAEVESTWRLQMRFEPRISRSQGDDLYAGWLEAVDLASEWRGVKRDRTDPLAHDRRIDALSPREREVMRLVSNGWSTREIASLFHTNLKTVEKQRREAMAKLGIANLAEVVRFFVDSGLSRSFPPHSTLPRDQVRDV
jgi:glycerol kinase